jgi:hypothetical protein
MYPRFSHGFSHGVFTASRVPLEIRPLIQKFVAILALLSLVSAETVDDFWTHTN